MTEQNEIAWPESPPRYSKHDRLKAETNSHYTLKHEDSALLVTHLCQKRRAQHLAQEVGRGEETDVEGRRTAQVKVLDPVVKACMGAPVDEVAVLVAAGRIAVEEGGAGLLRVAIELETASHADVTRHQEQECQRVSQVALAREGDHCGTPGYLLEKTFLSLAI